VVARSENTLRAPSIVERFVKQLNIAFKAVRLYPPSSAIPRESASTVVSTLRAILRDEPEMILVVTKEGLFQGAGAIHPEHEAYEQFAHEFYARHLADVRFHAGVTPAEVVSFLRILDAPVEDFRDGDEFEARLWEANCVNITVTPTSTKIVEAEELGEGAAGADSWPPTAEQVDEFIAGAFGGRSRDQRLLVRVVGDPALVGEYLREAVGRGGATSEELWVASRVAALAHALQTEPSAQRGEHYKAIADGLMGLEPALRRDILQEALLPNARHDDTLVEVVRRIGLDDVCDALAFGVEESAASREGLARALRTLVLIGFSDRDELTEAVGSSLERAGSSPGFVAQVVEGSEPTVLSVRETHRPPDESPVSRILQLVDAAPGTLGIPAGEVPEVRALEEEARQGISDGDVMVALVALVALEARPDAFNRLMVLVEDNIGLLIERQEFELAEEVAEALVRVSADPDREDAQRQRARTALDLLTGKAQIRQIVSVMRWYRRDTPEYETCERLLRVLGSHAIAPLLEVLADEPDRSARKAIVDLVSDVSDEHTDTLVAYLGDERWYFVRNIVTILGASGRPEADTHLERTLRHSDARVRRETIRAVAGSRGSRSEDMLIAALEDDAAQNVQLASRYLGARGSRKAVADLHAVALGRGRGDRSHASRIEAVEALGRIGEPESVPVLESIARSRSIRSRSRARELRTAASAALDTISSRDEEVS
jgi:HEAT repeat protein